MPGWCEGESVPDGLVEVMMSITGVEAPIAMSHDNNHDVADPCLSVCNVVYDSHPLTLRSAIVVHKRA